MITSFDDYVASALKELEIGITHAHRECFHQSIPNFHSTAFLRMGSPPSSPGRQQISTASSPGRQWERQIGGTSSPGRQCQIIPQPPPSAFHSDAASPPTKNLPILFSTPCSNTAEMSSMVPGTIVDIPDSPPPELWTECKTGSREASKTTTADSRQASRRRSSKMAHSISPSTEKRRASRSPGKVNGVGTTAASNDATFEKGFVPHDVPVSLPEKAIPYIRSSTGDTGGRKASIIHVSNNRASDENTPESPYIRSSTGDAGGRKTSIIHVSNNRASDENTPELYGLVPSTGIHCNGVSNSHTTTPHVPHVIQQMMSDEDNGSEEGSISPVESSPKNGAINGACKGTARDSAASAASERRGNFKRTNSHKSVNFGTDVEDREPQARSQISIKSNMQDDSFAFELGKAWVSGPMYRSVTMSTAGTNSVSHYDSLDKVIQSSDSDSDTSSQSNLSMASVKNSPHTKHRCPGLSHCVRKFKKRTVGMISDPGSPKRLIWDFVGALLVCYEFVMVPLEMMSVPEGTYYSTMMWIIRIFWLLDFPFSFMTGYYKPDGSLEVRVGKAWQHYMQTWMGFDLVVLILDWLELVLSTGVTGARVVRTTKAFRLFKLARLVRFIKINHMPAAVRSLSYLFQSEAAQIMLGLVRLVIMLAGITHVLACFWYQIGADSGGWTNHYNIESRDLTFRYVSSMVWSVSQITGNTDIYPVNGVERGFSVVAMLFGFLVSACVVSSITSSLTRLEIVAAGQSTQISRLKQYLLNNGISPKTSVRVQRNALWAIQQRAKHTPEGAIELLNLVSSPLRIEIHYEIYMPVFGHHLFFCCYNELNTPAMRRICHTCVTRLHVARGDVIFSCGEIPEIPSMYFVISGRLTYAKHNIFQEDSKVVSHAVHEGEWACEPVLWTNCWAYLGVLQCKSECSLVLLDADKFQNTAYNFQTRDFLPKKYAAEFVSSINVIPKSVLSDLHMEDLNLRDMCAQVFPMNSTSKKLVKSQSKRLDGGRNSPAPGILQAGLQKLKKQCTGTFAG